MIGIVQRMFARYLYKRYYGYYQFWYCLPTTTFSSLLFVSDRYARTVGRTGWCTQFFYHPKSDAHPTGFQCTDRQGVIADLYILLSLQRTYWATIKPLSAQSGTINTLLIKFSLKGGLIVKTEVRLLLRVGTWKVLKRQWNLEMKAVH